MHNFGTRDRGCSAHPAFPAPSFSKRRNEFAKPRAKTCRENAVARHSGAPRSGEPGIHTPRRVLFEKKTVHLAVTLRCEPLRASKGDGAPGRPLGAKQPSFEAREHPAWSQRAVRPSHLRMTAPVWRPHSRSPLLTPPKLVIKYNHSGQETKNPWETPSRPPVAANPSC